ncbi:hypothetical protein AK830_g5915 [Neonectria ditissima]|uniref:RRM domain-containing protein n=1 Tax=Neonectria ditissima TaxID=78410 RepID=A0A0P7ASC6_9HYPO|nr:hypothetical protein AK830_g5915 [Neonectria ditissima]
MSPTYGDGLTIFFQASPYPRCNIRRHCIRGWQFHTASLVYRHSRRGITAYSEHRSALLRAASSLTMPIQATSQADVGAGNQTGVYYIPICNLPFGTSWKDLKDWIGPACAVEGIEVFPKSTSGWVCLNGKDNFERAWRLLNGGVFKGRSIIASDKNRTEPIKIKEPAGSSKTANSQTPRSQATPPPAQPGSPASADSSPQYSAASGDQYSLSGYTQEDALAFADQPAAAYSHGYPASNLTATVMPQTYAAADPGECYCYDGPSGRFGLMDPIAPCYAPHHQSEEAQFALPYRGRPEASYYDESYAASSFPQPEYAYAEPRKLHVSPFPQQADLKQVSSWIYRKVGFCRMVTLDIPQNSDSKYLRGYAYILFEDATGAAQARDSLKRARFQGRRVTPRLMVDGEEMHVYEPPVSPQATVPEPMPPAGPSRSRAVSGGPSERIRRSKNGGVKGRASSDSSTRRSLSHHRKSSSSSKKPTTPKKQSLPERKRDDNSGPVIVDGTTHKHAKE